MKQVPPGDRIGTETAQKLQLQTTTEEDLAQFKKQMNEKATLEQWDNPCPINQTNIASIFTIDI